MTKLSATIIILAFALCVVLGNPTPKAVVPWQGRIVGGETATDGQFPYQARVRTATGVFLCSGAIVNNKWIVSVAQCLNGRAISETRVSLGFNGVNDGGLMFVLDIIVHEAFNANTLANNIALVQTIAEIIYSSLVQPIYLGSVFLGGGNSVEISGWGQTSSVS